MGGYLDSPHDGSCNRLHARSTLLGVASVVLNRVPHAAVAHHLAMGTAPLDRLIAAGPAAHVHGVRPIDIGHLRYRWTKQKIHLT